MMRRKSRKRRKKKRKTKKNKKGGSWSLKKTMKKYKKVNCSPNHQKIS